MIGGAYEVRMPDCFKIKSKHGYIDIYIYLYVK